MQADTQVLVLKTGYFVAAQAEQNVLPASVQPSQRGSQEEQVFTPEL